MSFLVAAPESLTAAAADLGGIGSTIDAARAAAIAPTSDLLAAGIDEVSQAIAAVFAENARTFRSLSAQASGFHQQFVDLIQASARSYSAVEAANANPLQSLLNALNAPTEYILGRPLIGNGANATGAMS